MTKLAKAKRRIKQLERLVDWIENWQRDRMIDLNAQGHDEEDSSEYKDLRRLRTRIHRTPVNSTI